MKHNVEKTPKVALCRACYGTGKVKKVVEYPCAVLVTARVLYRERPNFLPGFSEKRK